MGGHTGSLKSPVGDPEIVPLPMDVRAAMHGSTHIEKDECILRRLCWKSCERKKVVEELPGYMKDQVSVSKK